MIVKNYEELDTNFIGNVRTKQGLGLCFFNPETETLQEFSSDTSIPILPYEESIKRYYIVRDQGGLSVSTINLTFLTTDENYEVKNITGKPEVTLADFKDIPASNTNIIFISEYAGSVIPIDVYIKSKTYTLTSVPLVVEVDAT